MKEPTNTLDHTQHRSLLDTTSFKGRDVATGQEHEVSLRHSDGTLGIDSVGDNHYVSAYDNKNNRHLRSESHIFKTENDARNFIDRHNQTMKSQVVVNTSPPASVDEQERLYNQKLRHAEENKLRENRTSSGPLLDGDNY